MQTLRINPLKGKYPAVQDLYEKERAGDGIRTHGIPPWEGGALPLGDTRLENYFIELEGICQ